MCVWGGGAVRGGGSRRGAWCSASLRQGSCIPSTALGEMLLTVPHAALMLRYALQNDDVVVWGRLAATRAVQAMSATPAREKTGADQAGLNSSPICVTG